MRVRVCRCVCVYLCVCVYINISYLCVYMEGRTAHTVDSVVTDAVFHAPMSALKAYALLNACEPTTRGGPHRAAPSLDAAILPATKRLTSSTTTLTYMCPGPGPLQPGIQPTSALRLLAPGHCRLRTSVARRPKGRIPRTCLSQTRCSNRRCSH